MKSIGKIYTEWIINTVQKTEYVDEAIEIGKEIDALISERRIDEAQDRFKTVSKVTEIPIPLKIQNFFKNLKEIRIVQSKHNTEYEVPEGIYHSIAENVRRGGKDNYVLKIPHKLSYMQVCAISRKLWEDYQKLVFIITPEVEINGRILSDVKTYENIEILRGFIKEKDGAKIHNINTIGDYGSKTKGQQLTNVLSMRVHRYQFITENNIKYVIFSDKKLELGKCKIKGLSIPIHDRKKIGEEAKNKTILDVIILHTYIPFILNVDEKKVKELKKSIDSHEKLAEKMFGNMRHPDWFEILLFSIIVTKDDYEFPCHFLMIGPAGSGKSRGVLKPLSIAFDEPAGIMSGSSTLKGLIPSFNENPPKIGHLCESETIALIDEFFNFVKTENTGAPKGAKNFGMLKDVLDKIEKNYSSGNADVNTVMDSVMIAVTNIDEYNNLTTVPDICSNLDRPFLSRLLIYYQSEQHVGFIHNNKSDNKIYPSINRSFLSIFTWLIHNKVKGFDNDEADKIFKKYLKIIPGICREIYQGRYRDHLKCIITGVCKYRWLIGEKESLVVDENDYVLTDEIFGNVIASWINDDNINSLPVRVRLSRLGIIEKMVYDFISENRGMLIGNTINELKNYINMSESEIELALTRLENYEIIKKAEIREERHYVPFWWKKQEEKL